jgi:hypothetical protein
MHANKLCHNSKLFPTKTLQKEIFKGMELNIVAIEILLCLVMLYNYLITLHVAVGKVTNNLRVN